MVDLANRGAVVGAGGLQGGVLVLIKAKVAFAVLDVPLAVLCLGTSTIGAMAFSALSTSSTDFVGSFALRRSSHSMALRRIVRGRGAGLAALLAMAILIAAAVVAFGAPMSLALSGVIDHKHARPSDKASRQLRVERASGNVAALQDSFDTDDFGAGLGSVPASIFPNVALDNLGLPFFPASTDPACLCAEPAFRGAPLRPATLGDIRA